VKYWCYDFSKFVLWLFFRLGFGFEVRGREHVPRDGAFILASNHLSYLDPPLLAAACRRRLSFMARANLFEQPLLGAYLRAVHVIALQRGEGDLGAIREAVRRLQQGDAVAIFPEGGRQFSGQLGRAKRGVGLLAATAHVPIVPVLVQGTFQALPPDSHRLHRAKIRVAFGPAIPYTVPTVLPTDASANLQAEEGQPVARDRHEQLADALTHQWRRLAEQLNG